MHIRIHRHAQNYPNCGLVKKYYTDRSSPLPTHIIGTPTLNHYEDRYIGCQTPRGVSIKDSFGGTKESIIKTTPTQAAEAKGN